MQIRVLVKPKSKVSKVVRELDGSFTVMVNVPPVEGKANQAVIAALADFFAVPKTSIHLIGGARSRRKVFQIPD